MDQLKPDALYDPTRVQPSNPTFTDLRQPPPADPRVLSTCPHPNSSQMTETEVHNNMAARKMQKAGREKLRRDRLNEQFIELGNTLDPDRPKNDKATILADTVQLLKDLTSQVNKLKTEYATLTDESRELTQEKNDLREEKASLKSDIDNLNFQYNQRLRSMCPWGTVDQSVVMAPPSYPFPVPLHIPPGSIPMHPSVQPYPFFATQNPAAIHNPSSTFVPYVTPNTVIDQQSTQQLSSLARPASRSNASSKQNSKNKSSGDKSEKCEDSNDVTTDLELKIPGSTNDQDLTSGEKKSRKSPRKETSVSVTEGTASSRCSSSHSVHNSPSNNVLGSANTDDLDQ